LATLIEALLLDELAGLSEEQVQRLVSGTGRD
jgi:hypothetical protein